MPPPAVRSSTCSGRLATVSAITRRQEKIETCLENTLETVYPGIQISTKDSEFLAIDYVALYGAGIATVDEAREQLGLGESEQKVIDAAQKTIDNINSLSPLVANNVLANMTVNEKRALAGLPPIEGGDVLANTPSEAPEPTTFTFHLLLLKLKPVIVFVLPEVTLVHNV